MRAYFNKGITHNRVDTVRGVRVVVVDTAGRVDVTDVVGIADVRRTQPDVAGLTTMNLYLYTAPRHYCALRVTGFAPLRHAPSNI